jgi:hypothetical protein
VQNKPNNSRSFRELSKEEIEMITGFDKIDDNHLDTN